jgi:hypothetical protein
MVGPSIAGIGFVLFARTGLDGNYWTQYFPAVVALGLGMVITISPLTTAMLGAVSQDHAGIASGVNNAVARTASLVAVAVFGIVVAGIFYNVVITDLAALHLTPAVEQSIVAQIDRLAGIQTPTNLPPTVHKAIQGVIDSAFIQGFRAAMLLGAGLAFLSALVAGWLVEDG